MLIPCERHTKRDKDLWREYEEADRVHGESSQLQKKIAQSLEVIGKFIRERCYVSISGGKDSSVLWHLVHLVNNELPVRWLATEPLIDPYCRQVIAALNNSFPMSDYREHTNWCRKDDRGWHATGTIEDGIDRIVNEVGTRRCLLGIRADESGTRKLRCLRWRFETAYTCAPLAWWTAQDIYAYSARNDIPLHPTYGMLGGGRWPRDRLRVSFLGLRHGDGIGRAEWEQEYYGPELRRMEVG